MAKKRRSVNVSEAIRTYITANPDVGPKDAAAAISKETGKKVSPTYVSNVKSTMKGKGKKKTRHGHKPGPKADHARQSGKGGLDLPTIEGFMAMVRKVGKATAKRLMDLFE